jgi:hypothetical protein
MAHEPPFVKVLRRVDVPRPKDPGQPGPPPGGPPGPPDFVQTAVVSFSGVAPLSLVVRVRPRNALATLKELGPNRRPPVSHQQGRSPFKQPKGIP